MEGKPTGSMHGRPVSRLHLKQHLDSLHNPQPRRLPVQVALLKHGIRVQGSVDRRFVAVLLHQELGGAVDVEVWNNGISLPDPTAGCGNAVTV